MGNEFKKIANESGDTNAEVTEADVFLVDTGGSNRITLNSDGSGSCILATGAGGGISNIVEDTTPQLGGNLDVNGKTLGAQAADLNMNTHKIVGVTDPTTNQEAATKKYVDDNAGSSVPSGSQGDMLYRGSAGWQSLSGIYNVESYGATPDSSGDNDATAINAAIVQANADGGGTVILPAGTYHTTTSILLKNNVLLKGSGNAGSIQGSAPKGAVIHANVTPAIQTSSGTVTQNTGLENVALYTTTKTGSSDVALRLYSVQHSSFKQIYIEGWTNGIGIHMQPNAAGQYSHGNLFDDIRIGYYNLLGVKTIGVGIKFDGLWNGGAVNAGATDNSWRHIQIYWPKTYGIWFRNMVDNERFYYCILRGDQNASTLVKFMDPAGENINVTNNVFYDLTLTQTNDTGETVVGIDFDNNNGCHEFYGLQFAGDNGGWLGTELDLTSVGANFKMYGTGIRSTKIGASVYDYKMQWQAGNRYNIMNGGDQFWRDTDGGANLLTLDGSTGALTTKAITSDGAITSNSSINSSAAAAASYGELSIYSGGVKRISFAANNAASYLDYTGSLNIRTISTSTRFVLDSAGGIWTYGKLTAGANEIEGSNFDINGGTIDGVSVINSTGIITSNSSIHSSVSAAASYGDFNILSGSTSRLKIFANNAASYFDYTGNLLFRTIAGANKAVLYSTGDMALDGGLSEYAWTLDKEFADRKWELIDSILLSYTTHDGSKLDPVLQVKKEGKDGTTIYGKRPSDLTQVAIECISELKEKVDAQALCISQLQNRLKVLESKMESK